MIHYKNDKLPIYHINLEYICSKTNSIKDFKKDIKQIIKLYPNLSFLEEHETPFCYCINGWKEENEKLDIRTIYLIYLENKELRLKINFPQIAHESFHAVVEVMNNIGESYNYKNQESWAYLIEYFSKQSAEFLRNNKIKL